MRPSIEPGAPAGLIDRFGYLAYGLAAVLAFAGTKMLLSDILHIDGSPGEPPSHG